MALPQKMGSFEMDRDRSDRMGINSARLDEYGVGRFSGTLLTK